MQRDLADSPDLPDLIVIGDSHSNALLAGCFAHGMRVEMLRFSGNIWHSGAVVAHEEHGLWVHKNKAMQTQILELRGRLGGRAVLNADVPVLLSAGFHLGRYVPPFGALGHVTEARQFETDPAAQYVSNRFASAYLGAHRGVHLRVIRRMARVASLLVVAPPVCKDVPNMHRFLALQKARMEAVGLQVFDPNAAFGTVDHCLPDSFIDTDGKHGNDSYGAAVIGALIAQGLVAAPVQKPKVPEPRPVAKTGTRKSSATKSTVRKSA